MAAAAAQENRPNKRPGWMSIPGGPKEPNFQEFRNKMIALNEKKSKLVERLREIQSGLGVRGEDSEREAIFSERKALRDRMTTIDSLRKKERDARSTKNEEIARVRRQRIDVENKLKELSNDLGAFRDLADIEAAIDHIMTKMETGAGGLSSEKRTIKRLQQLEEAKSLLLQLQPLQEAIADAEDREASLQQEYREIHERIGQLNKDYEEFFTTKQAKDKEVAKTSVDRTALITERESIRDELTKLNEEMTALREAFNKQKEAWEAWREEAIKKYAEKIEAERKERQRQWLERQNADKIARKKARALKRQNPYESEIHTVTTLISYLKDRLVMSQRDEEDRKRRAAMATFDPAASAPKGFVLTGDVALPKSKAAKPTKAATEASKERPVNHTEEKNRQFGLIGIAVPKTIGAIEGTIAALKAKQAEYESHIKSGEIELSSDDEEEEEKNEVAAEGEKAPEVVADESA